MYLFCFTLPYPCLDRSQRTDLLKFSETGVLPCDHATLFYLRFLTPHFLYSKVKTEFMAPAVATYRHCQMCCVLVHVRVKQCAQNWRRKNWRRKNWRRKNWAAVKKIGKRDVRYLTPHASYIYIYIITTRFQRSHPARSTAFSCCALHTGSGCAREGGWAKHSGRR